tara:strand:- start:3949 stop:4167 length:219 start_codon:yes stop_codon:yes gene_type:complete
MATYKYQLEIEMDERELEMDNSNRASYCHTSLSTQNEIKEFLKSFLTYRNPYDERKYMANVKIVAKREKRNG